jgi:hypothetical protein
MPQPSNNIPYPQLYNLVLRLLREQGGVASVRQQLEFVIRHTNFVGEVRKLQHRLGWVRTSLKGVGLIRSVGRGIWQLTDLGYLAPDLELIERGAAPPTITRWRRVNDFLSPERVRSSADHIELLLYVETITDADVEVQPLTADYLRKVVVPLISAFDDVQQLLSLEWGLQLPPLAVIGLSRTDPKFTFEGSGEILEGVLKHTVPWRKKNFKRLEELKIAEKETEIEKRRAEQKEIEARRARD